MGEFKSRRSSRVALQIPIRIFGIDYRGVVFTEEAFTAVVSLHGAKVRMTHQLLPEAEIRVLCHSTGLDSVFRVVSQVGSAEVQFTYWGMENLEPKPDFWGVSLPELHPDDQLTIRVPLECPVCSARDSMRADEALLLELQEKGGIDRVCSICKSSGFWRLPTLPIT